MANTVSSSENDADGHQEGDFRASEYVRPEGDAEHMGHDPSEADTAYRPNTEAFDAGADIWAMLSVIQRD